MKRSKEKLDTTISIGASDEALEGRYINTVQVIHSHEEFLIDFLNVFGPKGRLLFRAVVTPSHMKRVVSALQDNIRKYEKANGKIK